MEQVQKKESQEIIALNILAKAAENYLSGLDELARGPTTEHLRNAITILAKAVTKSQDTESEVVAQEQKKK